MTLQAELCLCPDISTDSKWSTVDLRSLFDSGGLSSLWNDLVRSGELVSNDADLTGTGQLFSYSYFPNTQFGFKIGKRQKFTLFSNI